MEKINTVINGATWSATGRAALSAHPLNKRLSLSNPGTPVGSKRSLERDTTKGNQETPPKFIKKK